MKVYKIRNKETKEYWKSSAGRDTFSNKAPAVNSFNKSRRTIHTFPYTKNKFYEQDTYELVEFVLVETKDDGNE